MIEKWWGAARTESKQVMASSSVSTGERLLALIDDIELISK
jgi:hypothetical protein